MVFGFFMIVHILVSFLLIGVILVQGGRGGLGEALGGSGGSSLFGGGGNAVMTKVTAVGAATFMVTCLLLAKLSSQRGRSVIERVPVTLPDVVPALPAPSEALKKTTEEAEAVVEEAKAVIEQETAPVVSEVTEMVEQGIEEVQVPMSSPEAAAPVALPES